ncbi:MAG: efflux transporter outer membrane subunit [Sphingobium sp.]
MKRVLATVSLMTLAACNMAPANIRPEPPIPAQWPQGPAYAATPPDSATPAGLPWQDFISDTRLATLIDRALTANRDLRATMASVLAARARYRSTRSAQLPTINATGATTITRSDGSTSENYVAELGISAFEIDLFGRVRNESRSALESWLATREGARSAQISLVAETASAYATLAADRQLLALAERTAESAQRSLELTQTLHKAGLVSGLDMQQAETVLQRARSDVASTTTQVAQDRNALELMSGGPVEDDLLPQSLDGLSAGIAKVPAGLSSSVLLNRPDVQQAEHQLRAANADLGAARAALFPTISLTAALGVASSALSSLFTNDQFEASATPSARYAIFGGGKGANVDYAKAERERMIAQYEGAIQTAFQEVADALARAGTIDDQQAAQRSLVVASRKYHDLADRRYRGGIDDYQTALDAQRTLYSAEKTAIATDLAAITNRITLYRVIGADFSGS